MSSWFTIARLLPGSLGLNGSAANAEIVATSLRHLGHTVTIVDIEQPADVVSAVDLVCVGSGSGSQLRPAATQLLGLVRNLQEWKRQGAWFFAVGTGWDLLGGHIALEAGEVLPGAGVFPSSADHTTSRFSGEVSGVDYKGRPSAGYINQVGASSLETGGESLLSITQASADYHDADGVIAPGLMATRLGGPALALNPHWSDDIVTALLATRGERFQPTEFHDRVTVAAAKARAKIEERLLSSR
jgi:CobQ-like glutamine amidotransferase family enzyme